MIGSTLIDYALFVDGRGYVGKASSVKLPDIVIKTEEFHAGGMVAPLKVPLGHLEKAMEAEITLHTLAVEILESFGIHPGSSTAFTLRGIFTDDFGIEHARVVSMRGAINSYDEDAWEPSKKINTKLKVLPSYYKDVVDGKTHFEVDTQNYTLVVGGKDLMAGRRGILGL